MEDIHSSPSIQLFEEKDLAYLESVPIGVVAVDEEGQIQMVNVKAKEIFGYTHLEMIGKTLEMLLPKRFTEIHHGHRQDYFAAPRARPMGLGFELSGLRKNGQEFPVEVGLSKIAIGEQQLALAFITDITVRVQAAESLRRYASDLEARVAERTHEIERRRKVAEGLHDVLTILNTARPLEEILDHIVEQAHRLLATDALAIYRQDENQTPMQIVAMRPLGETTLQREAMIAPQVAYDLTVPTLDNSTRGDTNLGRVSRYRSVLSVPLNVKGEVYGSISLYYRHPRAFTAEDRELAVAFADQAALAIENDRLRAQAEQSAVTAERNRLARDLHDAVTQTLFSTSLIAEVLPRLWDRNQDEARKRLAEMRELTRGALAEMRTLLLELRPSALTASALSDLLHQLAEAATGRARLPVTVSIEGRSELPVDVKVSLYRIAQEALNNVVKHAGATEVTVLLRHEPTHLRLIIRDNGTRF